jgi:hypothetical protein
VLWIIFVAKKRLSMVSVVSNLIWICGVFVFCLRAFVVGDDVANCGGFVKPAAELAKFAPKNIDYSNVQLSLMTLHGYIKYTTECAPNGYYVIPVYDRGTYKIRVLQPNGWAFEPSEAFVTVGDDRRCNNGQDINFLVTGFQVSGKVVSDVNCKTAQEEGSGGLHKVKISLVSASVASRLYTTTTDESGIYRFTNVFPDTYTITAEHPSWSFSKNSTKVIVTWGTVEVPENLIVSGYDVRGVVRDQTSEGDAVSGVEFLLFADNPAVLNSCVPPKDYSSYFPNRPGFLLCAVRSDAKGEFVFTDIPCGNYTLVPFYRGVQTTFDVLPASLPFTVDRGSVVLSSPFLVKGFSITGRVVNSKNEGIEGVNVTMSKTLKSTLTDHNGVYKFDQVISDTYTFTATKEHYVFSNTLTNLRVTPNIGTLPDIKVSKYDLCGRVRITAMPPSVTTTTNRRQIFLKGDHGTEMTTFTDISGYYCFQVPPGNEKYQIIPVITKEEAAGGLVLTPQKLVVTVNDSPFLEANFAQAKLTVSGRVRCIEIPCTHSISVFLYALGHNEDHMTTGLAPNSILDNRAANVDYFVFKDVLPGKYEVKIEQQGWCWVQDSFVIELTTKDLSDIEFIQRGYLLTIESSHNVTVELRAVADNHERYTLVLHKGLNQHCVNKSGLYELNPTTTCFKFERDIYLFDTSAPPQLIKLNVVSHIVTGIILATEETKNIVVDVIVNDEKNTTISAKFDKYEGNKYIYRYSYNDTQPHQRIVFQPRSETLFFYPRTLSTTVKSLDECVSPLPPFDARPGLVFKGKIIPPLEGVEVRVMSGNNFDEVVLNNVTTNQKGEYQVGPLYDDRPYKVSVFKEGFHFKEDLNTPGNFRMIKLSRVSVFVREERTKTPLSGVLLSLTGENYRNNNLTNNDGSFNFTHLFPGQYYLKPLLKEYAFEPPAKTLDVGDGVNVQVTFKAKRVAFSCYGSVRSLNNSTEPFVGIEALSVSSVGGENATANEYEETQADGNGNYRLRGLLPSKRYLVRVKSTGGNIERAAPPFHHVLVIDNDIHNVNFIVFRRNTKFDLTGIVNVSDHSFLSHLKVELVPIQEVIETSYSEIQEQEYESENKESETRVFQLGPSNFFEFSELSPRKYIVRLKTNLDPSIYNIESTEQEVYLTQNTNVVLEFTPTIKQTQEEARPTSFLVLVFVFVVVVLGYNYKTILSILKKWGQKESVLSSQRSEWLSHLPKAKKPKPK